MINLYLFNDNGKLVESQGRKAKGPFKWQPATERGGFFVQNLQMVDIILSK